MQKTKSPIRQSADPTFLLKQRFPNLRSLGFDLEYFPRYVNRRPMLHSLDVVLFTVIFSGSGRHIMEDAEYREEGCSIGITHLGQHHSLVTGPEGMEVMNVYLDPAVCPIPDLPPPLGSVLPEFLPLHPGIVHRLNRIVRIPVADPGPFVRLVKSFHDELRAGRDGWRDAAMLYYRLFLIECCRMVIATGALPSSPPMPGNTAVLEDLRLHLERTYERKHTLADLAKRARVNRNYLCRIFKRYTGMSVFDYLLERRLRAAMVRLRSGTEKILTIALESGFADPSFFNRKFRERVGVTPGEYRKRSC